MPQLPQKNLLIQARDIDGLIPSIDPRQSAKPFVIDGKNFVWDVKGPRSGFGYEAMSRAPLTDPSLIYTFRVENDIFLFGNSTILAHDTDSQTFYPVFVQPTNSIEWPWTEAIVGGNYYFCRKGVGIVEYDPDTRSFVLMVNIYIPANPVSICASHGRLVILGETQIAWSALDDANDLEPSLETGAGSQELGIIGGVAFIVRDVDDGFLTWTSKGLLKSTFRVGTTPFMHSPLDRKTAAINPFVIVAVADGYYIFLDRRGLQETSGERPKPFQALFNEFLSNELLKIRPLNVYTNYRMHYAQDQQLLFLSVALSSNPLVYEYAYVLYLPVNKFGIFNELHHSIGEFALGQGVDVGYQLGFIAPGGVVNKFNDSNYREVTTLSDDGFFWHKDFDMPARRETGVVMFPSLFTMSAEPLHYYTALEPGYYTKGIGVQGLTLPIDFAETAAEDVAGVYTFRSTISTAAGVGIIAAAKQPMTLLALDAFIRIGLFRWTEMEFDDQIGLVTHLSIGMDPITGDDDDEAEDWLLMGDIEEDWLVETGDEDWGFGISSGNEYVASLFGTNDGSAIFNADDPLINIATEGAMARFPALCSGLWHFVDIHAEEYPQSFHLKSLEFSGTVAGHI